MNKSALSLATIICVFFLLIVQYAFSEDLPRFFGVYVFENGKYVEVPRVETDKTKYNVQKRTFGTDYNVAHVVYRDLFVKAERTSFIKEGFLVIKDESWSDFNLLQIPKTGRFKGNETGQYKDNENRVVIFTSIGHGGGAGGVVFSYRGLEEEVKPTKIPLRKAKVGENAYIYVPPDTLEKGFYVIDYKKNGRGISGWNPVLIE